jgi:hypothetical protein
MKNLITIFLITLVVAGCRTKNENVALKAELEALAEENTLLAAGDIDMELTIVEYQAMLVEIDENLAGIDEKSGKVKAMATGSEGNVEDDIKLHLEHIHGTMTNTKHKIAHLQDNLDELYLDEAIDEEAIFALEMELDYAADEIIARDIVIDDLNDVVIEQDIDIDALSEAYAEQAVLSGVLYGALNTAYVVSGTKKELHQYGIIDKEGGFIGLGRVKSLAAEADESLFYPVSIDGTESIELQCKKAKLLTTHPEASYKLTVDKTIEDLTILDKAAFWELSDFLIIEIVRD